MSRETFADRTWYGDGYGGVLLAPLGWLYAWVAAMRRRWYRGGRGPRPDGLPPVLVVGNLSVGGTGKTPLTVALCTRLEASGLRVGVVSRGYGGRAGRGPWRVGRDDTAADVGDEPLLIRTLTGVPVIVGSDRDGCLRALAQDGLDLVISDDGLQHYRLHRDAEIVVVDGARGLGNGRCLPAGPLRETPARLRHADAVVVNGDGWQYDAAIAMQLVPADAVNLLDGRRLPLAAFAGTAVHALAGIGHPERFFAMLERHGLEVRRCALGDHAAPAREQWLPPGDLPVLMTEKDAIKQAHAPTARHWSVPVAAELLADGWQRLERVLATPLGLPAGALDGGGAAS